MFSKIQGYGSLPTVAEILKEGQRSKNVSVTLTQGMVKALEKQGGQYGMTWNEYAKRACAQAWVDSKLQITTNKSEGDALVMAMLAYADTLGDSDLDKAILKAINDMERLIEKKNVQNRYKRMIPEIQNLMNKGYSLDDIVNVAKVMGERTQL